MKIKNHRIAALCVCAFAIVTATQSFAASIVQASFCKNGTEIASMVYTGRDGGPNSDKEIYWKLLGKTPEGAYRVKIEPDKADGKTATLVGEISVSVRIRNQFGMGTAKTKKLTLVRDKIDSTKWYIPAKELKRIVALIDKKP